MENEPKSVPKNEYFEAYREAIINNNSLNRSEELVMPEDSANPELVGDEKESPINYFVDMEITLPSSRGDGTRDLYRVCKLARNNQMEVLGEYN